MVKLIEEKPEDVEAEGSQTMEGEGSQQLAEAWTGGLQLGLCRTREEVNLGAFDPRFKVVPSTGLPVDEAWKAHKQSVGDKDFCLKYYAYAGGRYAHTGYYVKQHPTGPGAQPTGLLWKNEWFSLMATIYELRHCKPFTESTKVFMDFGGAYLLYRVLGIDVDFRKYILDFRAANPKLRISLNIPLDDALQYATAQAEMRENLQNAYRELQNLKGARKQEQALLLAAEYTNEKDKKSEEIERKEKEFAAKFADMKAQHEKEIADMKAEVREFEERERHLTEVAASERKELEAERKEREKETEALAKKIEEMAKKMKDTETMQAQIQELQDNIAHKTREVDSLSSAMQEKEQAAVKATLAAKKMEEAAKQMEDALSLSQSHNFEVYTKNRAAKAKADAELAAAKAALARAHEEQKQMEEEMTASIEAVKDLTVSHERLVEFNNDQGQAFSAQVMELKEGYARGYRRLLEEQRSLEVALRLQQEEDDAARREAKARSDAQGKQRGKRKLEEKPVKLEEKPVKLEDKPVKREEEDRDNKRGKPAKRGSTSRG